jgi:DNA-binding IclR family transcriptional regulator
MISHDEINRSRRYRIKVLEKTFRILELFDEQHKELTATEVSEALHMNKASSFRILKNLEDADFLEKDVQNSKYRLGTKIYQLGQLAEPYTRLKNIAKPFLEDLNKRCKETVHLAVLHQGEALYLAKIEGNKTIRVITRTGAKLPAHCSGVGKVLLAALSEKKLEEIVKERGLKRFTHNTLVRLNDLRAELARVREQGFAVDNEEIEDGLKCAAAPVRDSTGQVLAAISASVPMERFDREASKFISEVARTAKQISEALRKERVNGDYLSLRG